LSILKSKGIRKMNRTVTMTEAKEKLDEFDEASEAGSVIVTRDGKPVLAVVPWRLYESIVETLDILADKELMGAIRRGVDEAEEGKGISWEQVKRDLNL
jgi:prevent-host-death family protein